jgi:uncharacterized membrane protein
MSDLVVITFNKEEDGLAALKHIRDIEHAGELTLADTAVVEKDADGKIHVKNEVSSGTETGAIGGGAVGLLLGTVFFPAVLGVAIGAAIGAAIGHSLGTGVDQDFVKDIQSELKPGTSALFAVVKTNPAALVAALRGFDGKVYQTTLGTELEESLNEALKSGS